MDTAISEIRALELREIELEAEKEWIRMRRREILELNQGARKPRSKMLSPEAGKTLFAGLKRSSHERSKTR